MPNSVEKPKILLDSDVIRHFLKGQQIHILPGLYRNRLIIVDVVQQELCRSQHLVTQVVNFINSFKIEILEFPAGDILILREFSQLRKRFGDGESACMAIARFRKHFIASSNLKDIKAYCERNGIIYLTTMDILVEAYYQKILTRAECDAFIIQVRRRGSRLPVNTLQEYIDLKNK